MGEAALALDQHIQPMVQISGHNHIGFPVSTLSSRLHGLWPLFDACSVLHPLAGLPRRPRGPPFSMVTRERAHQVLSATRDVLINRFMAHRGQFALLGEAPGDQCWGPANFQFLVHIRPNVLRLSSIALCSMPKPSGRKDLRPSGEIRLSTPAVASQLATDAAMTPPQASPNFAETECLFPPPRDARACLVIEMPVTLFHAPPPVAEAYRGALRFRIRGSLSWAN